MIKAVTVDFWGTLVLDGPGADESYRRARVARMQEVLNATGEAFSSKAINNAYEAGSRQAARAWAAHRDVPVSNHVGTILSALDAELQRRVTAVVMDKLLDAYASPLLQVPPTFDPHARSAVATVASYGYAVCIVSNILRTPGWVLRTLLDRAGIMSSIAAATFSDECGIRKPDPEIFRLALRQIGVAPEHAVHVGDDPMLDIEGARAAGMRVIHLNANRQPDRAKADATISTLEELPAKVLELDTRVAAGSRSAVTASALNARSRSAATHAPSKAKAS